MSQPTLTYALLWNQYNYAQKLSGKSYKHPNGYTVDCSYVDVKFSSDMAFKQFYATAVKGGKNYGFVDDVLIDFQGASPTGVLLHDYANGRASSEYTFRIYSSSLKDGDGTYRIGIYVQSTDGTWNYEYFFLTTETDGSHPQFNVKGGDPLQVPVKTN